MKKLNSRSKSSKINSDNKKKTRTWFRFPPDVSLTWHLTFIFLHSSHDMNSTRENECLKSKENSERKNKKTKEEKITCRNSQMRDLRIFFHIICSFYEILYFCFFILLFFTLFHFLQQLLRYHRGSLSTNFIIYTYNSLLLKA